MSADPHQARRERQVTLNAIAALRVDRDRCRRVAADGWWPCQLVEREDGPRYVRLTAEPFEGLGACLRWLLGSGRGELGVWHFARRTEDCEALR